MGELSALPEGCIANIISFTSPRDACRLSSVSKIYKSAAESDVVWERFLPPEYPTLISNSTSSSSLVGLSSKKELYLSLCDYPVLIDDGKKSFSLDKRSGKKCYMISARDLWIVWGSTPEYWTWSSITGSRFPEVAKLINVCWLEICGKISPHSLSPRTLYSAFFVYKLTETASGFESKPVEVMVAIVEIGSSHRAVYLAGGHQCRAIYLDPEGGRRYGNYYPMEREDDWLEIELGDFFYEGDEEGELEMNVWEVKGRHWKNGLLVQGIEIRPKQG